MAFRSVGIIRRTGQFGTLSFAHLRDSLIPTYKIQEISVSSYNHKKCEAPVLTANSRTFFLAFCFFLFGYFVLFIFVVVEDG